MAPLPPDSTGRAYLTYQVVGRVHTLTMRYDPESALPSEVVSALSDFIDAMSPLVYPSLFVKLETSAPGSNVRVPASYDGTLEWGSGTPDPDEAPFFYSFTGKDAAGRRFRAELFGAPSPQGHTWRKFAVDDSSVAAAIAVFEAESATWLTIGNAGPFINQYMNWSVSQHWIQEVRG